jgi:hypothetical protein
MEKGRALFQTGDRPFSISPMGRQLPEPPDGDSFRKGFAGLIDVNGVCHLQVTEERAAHGINYF